MSEQLDHRAAIEWAQKWADAYANIPYADMNDEEVGDINAARHILHSIKAAWPGVVPASDSSIHRTTAGHWAMRDYAYVGTGWRVWIAYANKFERDYPGLKVDDPWLVRALTGDQDTDFHAPPGGGT